MDKIHNICVIGPKGVGKTTYIQSFFSKKILKTYEPTANYKFYPMSFKTSHGTIRINLIDFAGDDIYKSDDYTEIYKKFSGCIVFMNKENDSNAIKMGIEYSCINSSPIIYIASKVDLQENIIDDIVNISTFWNFNMHIPIEDILRLVLKNDELKINPVVLQNMSCEFNN